MNYSLKEQLQQKKGKIVWLASYPKSGNTWIRAFLTALFQLNDNYDINNLMSDAYFPKRNTFDELTSINSRYLTMEEVHQYRPAYTDYIAKSHFSDRLLFTKIHDKFYNSSKSYINKNNTHKIIYIVRNPLSIVASLANHDDTSVDISIQKLNNPIETNQAEDVKTDPQPQFPQLLGSWSHHVLSWIDNPIFPVHLIKYEDLVHLPLETFSRLIEELELKTSVSAIKNALEQTSFSRLQSNEKEFGFAEKTSPNNLFFRKGKTDSWKEELTIEQQEIIISAHQSVMKRLNYL